MDRGERITAVRGKKDENGGYPFGTHLGGI